MVDLKKNSSSTELMQTEIRELSATNQQLKSELDTARFKLGNELDLLTYRLEKTQTDIQDIRRDVREISLTIDRLRYDLLEAMRKNKTPDVREIISSWLPIIAVTAPIMFIATVIFLAALSG